MKGNSSYKNKETTDSFDDEKLDREEKNKKHQRREELMSDGLFWTMYGIKRLFDDFYLDALIGIIPTFGDIVTTFLSLPCIMFCVFKVRSLALTLAVLNNYMIDMIIGMIPFWIGNIADFFYKSHRKNLDLIMGYIDDNQLVINEVNRKAVFSAIFLAILIFIFILMIKFVALIIEWIGFLMS